MANNPGEPAPQNSGQGPNEGVRQIGQAYSLVSTLTGPMLIGGAIDYFAKTLPWGLIGGVVLGAVMSLVVLVKMTQPKGPPSSKT